MFIGQLGELKFMCSGVHFNVSTPFIINVRVLSHIDLPYAFKKNFHYNYLYRRGSDILLKKGEYLTCLSTVWDVWAGSFCQSLSRCYHVDGPEVFISDTLWYAPSYDFQSLKLLQETVFFCHVIYCKHLLIAFVPKKNPLLSCQAYIIIHQPCCFPSFKIS